MKTTNTIRTRAAFEDAMESMNRHAEWDAKNRAYTWKRQFMMDEFHFFDADDKIVWVEGGHDFDVTLEWLLGLDAEEREVEREELTEREGDYITEYWDDLCPYTAEDYGVDADEDWVFDLPLPQCANASERNKVLIVTVIAEDDIAAPESDFEYATDGSEEDVQRVLEELRENGFDVVDYGVYDESLPESGGFDVPFDVEENTYGCDSVDFYREDGSCFLSFLDSRRDGHYAMYVPSSFSFEEDGAAAGRVTMKVFGISKLGAIFAKLKEMRLRNGPTFEAWVCVCSLYTRDVQDLYRAVEATLKSR